MRQQNTKAGRGARAYRTMLPEISARRSLFGAKFQIPVTRQGGREMSAPRPYVTDPFRPLSLIIGSNSYIYNSILVISAMWFVQVCLAVVHI